MKKIGIFLTILLIIIAGISFGRALPYKQREIKRQKMTPLTSTLPLVSRVIDGDTIEIEGGQKVRYIGIDTPETVDPRKPIQCLGEEASKKNKELVEGKRVRLEKDISEYDKYHRLLRYVYVDDMFINLELVRQGYAHVATFPPDISHQDEFRKAERQAREAKRGLWQACP